MSPKGTPSGYSRMSVIALSFFTRPVAPPNGGTSASSVRQRPSSLRRSLRRVEKDCRNATEGRVSCGAGGIGIFDRSGYGRDPETAKPAIPGSKCGSSDGA